MGLMSFRRLTLTVTIALCALSGALAFCGAAPAATQYALSDQFGAAGAGNGQFAGPAGVAVEQSSGDVYVVDQGNGRVEKFDPSGGYLSQFDGGGTPAASLSSPNGIAVDNSTNPLDPSAGDVYVVDVGHDVVDKFSAAGSYLGQLTGTSGGAFAGVPLDGVAVDGNGNVWVYQSSGEMDEFGNGVGNGFVSSWSMGLGSAPGLAVDFAGHVYAVTGCGCVEKFDSSGSDLGQLDGGPATAVAVDQTAGSVYVDDGSQVAQYDSSGSPLGQFGSGTLGAGSGIDVDSTGGQVYVADSSSNAIDVFALATVPDVSTGAASNVTSSAATLAGTVNPDGIEASCQFEYGTDTAYGQSAPCAESPGSGSGEVPVTASLAGLASGTTYHYRLDASNANGTSRGQDQTLTTSSQPVVDRESVSHAGVSGATLDAQVNPGGVDSTYHFEYGPDAGYGASVPVPDADLGSGSSDETASQTLSGLQSGAVYHYRIVVSNANGTVDGPDKVFTTFSSAGGAVADSCPNAQIREAQLTSSLADCRAYEMVSPADKNGGNIAAEQSFTQSSSDGNAIKYASQTAFADAPGIQARGAEYVSRRDAGGWSTHAINPPQTGTPYSLIVSSEYKAFSNDLSKGIYFARTPLTPGHPNVAEVPNLYLRSDVLSGPPGNYELLSESSSPLGHRRIRQQPGIAFAGASDDWSHIIFESIANLTPDASGTNPDLAKLYEWDNGTVRLAGILPDGTPAEGSVAGQGAGGGKEFAGGGWTEEAISADGSRIVFETAPYSASGIEGEFHVGDLYMRVAGRETIKLNVNERSEADTPAGATFWAATSDDSKIYFTTTQALTEDAPPASGNELYMYDVNAPEGHHLTLISVNSVPANLHIGAPQATAVTGISADGSYVYFISENQLNAGDPHSESNDNRRLYVWHDGTLRFIVTHDDGNDWASGRAWGSMGRFGSDAFRTTSDGKIIMFASIDPLTARRAGYDNPNIGTAQNPTYRSEIYVYHYDGDRLTCASCNPSGATPVSGAGFESQQNIDGNAYYALVSAQLTMYLNHAMTSDGRFVFFDTEDALVAQDTNGKRDVYEYDTVTGGVRLISNGTSREGSYFVDASPDGSNVFFTTYQQLVRSDTDGNADLYDARIDGGIPVQNQASPTPCAEDVCQGPAAGAPSSLLPSSLAFSGSGNAAQVVSKPAVNRKKKVKKSKPRKHKKKKKGKKRAKRSAGRSSHRAGR